MNKMMMINGSITTPRFIVMILSCTIILIPPGGITYGFTSITAYLLSCIVSNNPDGGVTKAALSWVYAALLLGQGISMVFGGLLEKFYSTRKITIGAVVLFNFNILVLHWSCQNIFSLVFSYFCTGLTLGVLYIMALVVGLSWVKPEYHGFCSGVLCIGYGLSSVFVSPLQGFYVNPNNVSPVMNVTVGDYLFDSLEIISHVPNMFTIFGVLSFIMQLPLAFVLVKNPDLHTEAVVHSRTIKGMLSRHEFYLLFVVFGLNKVPLAYIAANAKFYGEVFIRDDLILSVIVGCAGVFNALGRPFWGFVNDRLKVRIALFLLCFATAICILASYLSRYVHGAAGQELMYCLSVWGSFFCCTGNYAILPAATVYYFGQENLGTKYGLLYLSQGVGAMLSAVYGSLIPFWMPLVLTVVVTSLVSGCMCLVLPDNGQLNKYTMEDDEFTLLETHKRIGDRKYEELELQEMSSG